MPETWVEWAIFLTILAITLPVIVPFVVMFIFRGAKHWWRLVRALWSDLFRGESKYLEGDEGR